MLLRKHNTKRLYNENDAAKQLEAYAKESGMAVVSCNDPAWDEALLNWVVDPLTDAEEEKSEESEKGFSLKGCVGVERERSNHPGAAEDSESVPPVFNLHLGERITHIAIKRSNENKMRDGWRGGALLRVES